MRNKLFIATCLCLIVLLTAPFVAAQEKQEDVKVRLRLLPVTVLDSSGKPVKNLGAADFQLFVDGKQVQIRSVDEYDYGKVREQMSHGQNVEYTGADLPPRKIILLFDLLSSGLIGSEANPRAREEGFADATDRDSTSASSNRNRTRGIVQSKAAATEWVQNKMLPSDEVAVIQYHTSAKILQTYTGDKQSVLNAIDKVSMPVDLIGMAADEVSQRELQDNPDDPDYASIFQARQGGEEGAGDAPIEEDPPVFNFTSTDTMMASYYSNYVEFFRRLGKLLAGLPGTKEVILFSEGIAIDRNVENNTIQDAFNEAANALSSSNSRVTTISISGIDKSSLTSSNKSFLSQFANETGGNYYPDRARLEGAVREAVEKLDHYYEISFSPTPDEDSGFHSVEVKTDKPNVQVDTPSGYLGDSRYDQSSGLQSEIRMAQGFWMPIMNELGSEMTWDLLPYGEGKAALHLRTYIPEDEIPEEGRTEFDALLSIGQNNEKLDDLHWRITRDPGKEPVQMDIAIPLSAGTYSVQYLMMDRADGDRAYLMSGVDVGTKAGGMTMGPLYILPQQPASENVNIEEKLAPKVLTGSVPEPIQRLVTSQIVKNPAGGQIVTLSFVFRGAEFESTGVQFKRGEQRAALGGQQLKQEPLEDGFRLVSYLVQLPDWGSGPLTITPVYVSEGKAYALLSTDIMMR